MSNLKWLRQRRWRKIVVLILVLTLVSACQDRVARVGIPLAYGLTGLCLALLVSPTLTAAVVGFLIGCILGAAVYNNSLKSQFLER
jgi:uncharacterized integral membrane protein